MKKTVMTVLLCFMVWIIRLVCKLNISAEINTVINNL